MKTEHQKYLLEQLLRDIARLYSQKTESDTEAFRLMKKILQDELGLLEEV